MVYLLRCIIKLKEYSDLRNAIVHERIDGRVIAEPNDYAVAELKKIYDKISTPKKMIEICNHSVKTLSPNDSLSEALSLMNKHDFSQVPIYDNGVFVGMLNPTAISTWMGKIMLNGSINISEVIIKDVLVHKRTSRITLFRPKDVDVYEVLEIYKEYAIKTDRIDAIIITENGKKTDKPLTIVTDHDILEIVESV